MKKIFAIALALVMVLSMASAFAANCVVPNWACAEDVCALGKGKVEVIPYVKGNDCNNGNTWAANTCAGAVNGDSVYYAVKVTVDANPNTEWWADATLTFKETDVTVTKGANFSTEGDLAKAIKALDKDGELKAGEYYVCADGKVVKAEDFKASAATLYAATVNVASSAKVCAYLVATNNFVSAKVNGYDVSYANGVLTFVKGVKRVNVVVDSDKKVVAFDVSIDDGNTWKTIETYNVGQTKFYAKGGETFDWTCTDLGKFLKAVMADFALDFGTCVTEKAIKANFGWNDEVKACVTWSSNVQAVVDAECVVAIPKTGDASVLAWLF